MALKNKTKMKPAKQMNQTVKKQKKEPVTGAKKQSASKAPKAEKGEKAPSFSKEEQTLLKRKRRMDKVDESEEEDVLGLGDKEHGESQPDDGSFYSETYAQDSFGEADKW
jgi:hypothetical protein